MIRVFVVGTPRSGTTFFQSFLAAHPAICTFVESHALTHLNAGGRLRPVHPKAITRIHAFLAEVGRQDLARKLPKTRVSTQQWCNAIQDIFDQLAKDEHKRAWVEKTPRHLHHVDMIQRFDNAKVIHVVRDGPSTIASLMSVSKKHPDVWGRRSLKDCIERWQQDLKTTLHWALEPDHLVIRYGQLTAEPKRVMDAVYRHIGLPEHAAERSAGKLSTKAEPWKDSVSSDKKNTGRDRFHQLPQDQQDQVLAALGDAADRWS